MNTWQAREALPEHAAHIARHMREADRAEVWASGLQTPSEALEESLSRSVLAWTCFVDGVPAAMAGVCPRGSLFSRIGVPWLLATDALNAVRRSFARHSRFYVDAMQDAFPRLENYVHAGNSTSLRWLAWCGFSIDRAPVNINGEDFFLFWRER
ncbi:hypothetical protein LJC59_01315 [Desulfovibrio sp. OttesenSCG-928-A18]|nr:hypothetical protein [Desulfovibrio sp. OttesenSCG-928-A18]